MLDKDGFVAEANGVNLFCVRNGIVLTPHADACLPGITRGLVLEICQDLDIPSQEKNLSLTEFYTADEAFATGTMGELTRISEIDGRTVLNRSGYQRLDAISTEFEKRTRHSGVPIPNKPD